MAEIKVKEVSFKGDAYGFEVEIAESGSVTRHRVSVGITDYQSLTDGIITPLELVEKSFEFLLEREPKESILSDFDLNVIEKYFKDYPRIIKDYF